MLRDSAQCCRVLVHSDSDNDFFLEMLDNRLLIYNFIFLNTFFIVVVVVLFIFYFFILLSLLLDCFGVIVVGFILFFIFYFCFCSLGVFFGLFFLRGWGLGQCIWRRWLVTIFIL